MQGHRRRLDGADQAGGRFSLNPHQNLKGKVKYDDGAAADFRSTRLTEVTCNHASAQRHRGR